MLEVSCLVKIRVLSLAFFFKIARKHSKKTDHLTTRFLKTFCAGGMDVAKTTINECLCAINFKFFPRKCLRAFVIRCLMSFRDSWSLKVSAVNANRMWCNKRVQCLIMRTIFSLLGTKIWWVSLGPATLLGVNLLNAVVSSKQFDSSRTECWVNVFFYNCGWDRYDFKAQLSPVSRAECDKVATSSAASVFICGNNALMTTCVRGLWRSPRPIFLMSGEKKIKQCSERQRKWKTQSTDIFSNHAAFNPPNPRTP